MVNLECVLEGLHRSEIQSGTHNDPPTGCVSAWIDSGTHIKMATSYGTIEGEREDGPFLGVFAARDCAAPVAIMPKNGGRHSAA